MWCAACRKTQEENERLREALHKDYEAFQEIDASITGRNFATAQAIAKDGWKRTQATEQVKKERE